MSHLNLVLTSEGPLPVSAVTGTTDLLDLYGLSPGARSALQSQGAVFVRDLSDGMPLQPTPGLPTLSVSADSPAVPIGVFAMGGFSDSFDHLVVTQQFIDDSDLTTTGGPLFAVRDDPFDRAELQRLRSALTDVSGSESQVFLAAPPIERSLQIISPNPAQPDRSVIYRGWTSVLAMLLVLLVVAFGLALWAAEGRDENRMLAAIGASPSTLSRMTAWRAFTLTVTAAIVAVPFGYFSAKSVSVMSIGSGRSAPFPWLVAGVVLVAVPIVVTAVSYLVSTFGCRLRPATVIFAD